MILPDKNIIISRLQKEILALQGFKSPIPGNTMDLGLGPVAAAFPNGVFPTAAVHEFISAAPEHAAASGGFIAGILSGLMNHKGVCIWIGSRRTIFPPALKAFGVTSDQIIFIDLQKEKDLLWAMEEALKCTALTAVIGEIKEIDFTSSRRLQLAVEQSRVTGFILRHNPRSLNITAAVSRWKITAIASELEAGMPGVGFPRWQVELLKIRNGKPGSWKIEWRENGFHILSDEIAALHEEEQRKTG